MNFVTGATGFIGKYLVRSLLESGAPVYALTRSKNIDTRLSGKITWVHGDITQKLILPDDVVTVYHCAGTIYHEDQMEGVNVLGTRRIVDAALKRNCTLIHLSSAGIVGCSDQRELNEEIPCSPRNRYEKTKFEAEKIVLKAINSGLKAQILRPTIVFGLGRNPEQDSMLQLIRAIKNNRYRNVMGGKGIFNIIHVNEVVRAMIALHNDGIPNGGYYFINGPIPFHEFAQIVKKELTPGDETVSDMPYLIAFGAAAAFSGVARLIGRRMPFSLSRLTALTSQKVFSQKRLIEMTSYRPLHETEFYVKRICSEYSERGMID